MAQPDNLFKDGLIRPGQAVEQALYTKRLREEGQWLNGALPAEAESPATPRTQDFRTFLDFLKHSRGVDFTGYKLASLMRRVSKRMQAVGIEYFDEYRDYLAVHPEEFSPLFNAILINFTAFFRDAPAWNYLASKIIPLIIEGKPVSQPLRVWSPGCASGEEAYTLAMLLAEALGVQQFCQRVKIYATDIDEEALTQARRASYSDRDLKPVPARFRERYFKQERNRYVCCDALRHSVIFARHDLIHDAPLSRLDLLVCRNTLMYFNVETQTRTVVRFHFTLNDKGFLFLGKADMLFLDNSLFTRESLRFHIFTKGPRPNVRDHLLTLAQNSNARADANLVQHVRLREAALSAMSVAQVVVDPAGILLLANEQARTLVGLDLKDVGRSFLELDFSQRLAGLRLSIEQVITTRHPIPFRNVEWPVSPGETHYLDVSIVPLLDNGDLVGASINFTDVTHSKRLERELLRSSQALQAANEELQAANEALQVTKEELQPTREALEATGEALQAANGEVEAMHEQLQSTHEEFQTFHNELRQRHNELNTANALLKSVLASVRSAVVVVDRTFSILVWNRWAEDLWGLRAEEVQGRSLVNLDSGLPVEPLKGPVLTVLAGEFAYLDVVLDATNRRGKTIRCQVTCTPLLDTQREIQGVILFMEE